MRYLRYIFLAVFLLASSRAYAGAIITCGAFTLASDGRTLTSTLASGTAPYSPASPTQITNFTVVDNSVTIPCKVTVTSPTLTLFLSHQALSTDTVTVAGAAGNLTDSASNTLATFGAASITNSSTATAINLTQVASGNFASLPGLRAWYNVRSGQIYTDLGTTPATTDGQLVEQWNDLSGNGFNAVQTTSGKRPILKLGTNGLNGNTALLFNNAPYMLLPSGLTSSTFDQSITTFTVMKNTAASSFAVILGAGGANFFETANVLYTSTPPPNINQNATITGNLTTWSITSTSGTPTNCTYSSPTVVDTFYYDGAHSYCNANGWDTQYVTSGPTNVTTGNISISGQLAIGALNTASNPSQGEIVEEIICNQALTTAERSAVTTALYNLYSIKPDNLAVYVGDSITFGQGTTTNNDYPSQAQHQFAYGNNWTNLGVSGETLATMVTLVNSQVVPLYNPNRARNVAVIFAGTNDIGVSGATAAVTYANLLTWTAAVKTAGFKVVWVTMLPRTTGGSTTETQRQIYNTDIRSNYLTFADGLFDAGNNATVMGAPNAYTNTLYYQSDQIHPTDLGQGINAAGISAAIAAIYGNPVYPNSGQATRGRN